MQNPRFYHYHSKMENPSTNITTHPTHRRLFEDPHLLIDYIQMISLLIRLVPHTKESETVRKLFTKTLSLASQAKNFTN